MKEQLFIFVRLLFSYIKHVRLLVKRFLFNGLGIYRIEDSIPHVLLV